jgi:ferredoxin
VGSIPKIVSTPLKWASKKFIHATLLRFPGGDEHSPIACTYCPEMCRFSCPTAVASGNDAVTPCNKNSLLYKEQRWPGRAGGGGPLWTIYDCTGCGRCTNYCVYGMPVGEMLFEARKRFGWDRAREVAAGLGDAADPVGDLADELGDEAAAERRRKAFVAAAGEGGVTVDEARSCYFLQARGTAANLSWDQWLGQLPTSPAWERLRARLAGKRWLVHESVWFSRRLGKADDVRGWVERAGGLGAGLVLPFHAGKDCIDCGGEGAYARLFPEQAATMAREIWERDRHRADGVLCLSARCAAHFRAVLGASVQVVALGELGGANG